METIVTLNERLEERRRTLLYGRYYIGYQETERSNLIEIKGRLFMQGEESPILFYGNRHQLGYQYFKLNFNDSGSGLHPHGSARSDGLIQIEFDRNIDKSHLFVDYITIESNIVPWKTEGF